MRHFVLIPVLFLFSSSLLSPQGVITSEKKETKIDDSKIDSVLLKIEELKLDLLAQEIAKKDEKIKKNQGYIYNLEKKKKVSGKSLEKSKSQYVVKRKPTQKKSEIHLETEVKPEIFTTYIPVFECEDYRSWVSRQFNKDICRQWVLKDSIKIEIE